MAEDTGFEPLPDYNPDPAQMKTEESSTPITESKPWHNDLTPDDRRAAEMAEGARLAALRSAYPTLDTTHTATVQQAPGVPGESEAAKFNRELMARITAARNTPPPAPPPKPPVAPAMLSQTQREMTEGARISTRHAEQHAAALATRKPPSAAEIAASGSSTPVFRPDVPAPHMKEGNVRAVGKPA